MLGIPEICDPDPRYCDREACHFKCMIFVIGDFWYGAGDALKSLATMGNVNGRGIYYDFRPKVILNSRILTKRN